MTAVYNEIDPFAAAWLRELIKDGHIAPGEVWENDIRDIRPIDLRGVVQFHAFAGIGVWSYSARRAGWPDSRPLWTASCPCQPFSAAGAGGGFADERHLWPHYYHLVSVCRPAVVAGEQVASKDADPWIDLVQADMEAVGYAFGAVPFPSASIGAPHIRDRTYWLAYASQQQYYRTGVKGPRGRLEHSDGGATGRLVHHHHQGLEGRPGRDQAASGRQEPGRSVAPAGDLVGMADMHGHGCDQAGQRVATPGHDGLIGNRAVGGMADAKHAERRQIGIDRQDGCNRPNAGRQEAHSVAGACGQIRDPGPTNGFWRDPDWLFCRDGKWRPVEPGTFPLAHGAPARVGRLRGYGNAINAEQARIFLEEVQEIISPAVDACP